MTTFAQIFCSVNDLLLDPQPPAGSVDILYRMIKAASQTILQEIGEFIPVTETRKFDGEGKDSLYLPPFLAIITLSNDGTSVASTEYIKEPEGAFWRNGPYNRIEVDPDATVLSAFVDEDEGVEINARWGLYEETEPTGASVATTQTVGATSLVVDDGSKLSPGTVALLATEQELVTAFGTPTAAVTTLNGTIDDTQETITLTNGALVKVGEIIRIGLEQMRIEDIATHTVYVQRRWNNTKGAIHTTGAAVDVYRTFTVVRGVNGTTAAEHLATPTAVTISRYIVPADVLVLVKEIATLMLMKAASGYAGRTGNQETGQVFYNDLFPRFDIERIRDHYSIKTVR